MSIFSTLSHWFIPIISLFSCQKPSKNLFFRAQTLPDDTAPRSASRKLETIQTDSIPTLRPSDRPGGHGRSKNGRRTCRRKHVSYFWQSRRYRTYAVSLRHSMHIHKFRRCRFARGNQPERAKRARFNIFLTRTVQSCEYFTFSV